jgi:hypothetical protein
VPVAKLPDDLMAGATTAATQAQSGFKNSAYLQYLQSQIGANYLRRLVRNSVTVWQAQCSGLLPIVGSGFSVSGSATQTSISAASIASGTWAHYVINATDPTKFIATDVTSNVVTGPASLSSDLTAGGSVSMGDFFLNSPEFDLVTLNGLTASDISSSSATLSVVVGGAIPAGALMLFQTTTDENSGSWVSSPATSAIAGTFSWTATGLTAGTTYFYRALVYGQRGGVPVVVYAQTANSSFAVAANSGFTLAQAYATCMTSLNDFPPGNTAGATDWINSLWDISDYFQTSPYGSNIDPVRFGQSEPGVGTTDANYIVTRQASSGRSANSFVLWPWFMPPKGALQPAGNWRIQIRDCQAAVKVDALTNPWTLIYGPSQVPTYGLNNLGGLRVSGNLMDYTGTPVGSTFAVDANPIEARAEASGGISFRGVGFSLAQCLVELNTPDPRQTLPGYATPARTVAFAAVFWARLITDTGSGSVPAGLKIGAMLGVDFYDLTGRLGTPGQSRLVELETSWKPIVIAVVLTGLPPSVPQTPAVTSTWLVANPPPFV